MSLQQHWEATLTGRETPVTKMVGCRGIIPCLGVGDSVPKDVLIAALGSDFYRKGNPCDQYDGVKGA